MARKARVSLEVALAELRQLKKALDCALWYIQSQPKAHKDYHEVRKAQKTIARWESDTVLSPEVVYVADWTPLVVLVNTPLKSRRKGQGARAYRAAKLFQFAPIRIDPK